MPTGPCPAVPRDELAKKFKPGLFNHYKGGRYRALHLAKHHETEELFVVYVSMTNGSLRIREYATPGKDSWTDLVEFQGEMVQRFRHVDEGL